MRIALALVLVAAVTARAGAAPGGAHPRMLLDHDLRAAWQAQAKEAHGPVVGAIALCDEAGRSHEHDHAVYQGSEWSKVLQACLVAWAATGDKDHAATAVHFFTALLDDLDDIGDGKGGDTAASRDDGYAIRNLGPMTALAYDWLHDAPGMTPELRARARQRWKAWLAWYAAKGYRADKPGTNYYTGYLIAATMIAIAEHGEAGSDGDALWRLVADKMWKKDMAGAFAPGGILDGGDWPEGWQYGPLSVAEIALGARVMREAGVNVPGVDRWLAALLRHAVYSLAPDGGVFAGGDLEDETPNAKPSVLTLDAVALGDAPPDDRRWARGELSRLALADADYLLYDALAGVGDAPVLPPRAKWPTWWVATNTGTLFARTRWDDRATWFVFACQHGLDVDHRHPDAGNFVLSRGKDDVIVDPSPYGSQSTLTSNAPTVADGQLPKDYRPSQADWSEKTGFDFATQRKSGMVAARCDYSDQYKFQDRASDVPDALRDVVMVPSADGTSAVVVVIDRANTGDDDRAMYLRFRTPGHLALAGETATATVGGSKLVIEDVARSSGKAELGTGSAKDCYKEVRGQCDAARFPITDYRVQIAGPHPSAVHVIAAVDAGAAAPTAAPLAGNGWAGVRLAGVRDAVVAWRTKGAGSISLAAPPGALVIALDASPQATVKAKRDGDKCAVTITPEDDAHAAPAIAALDAACAVHADPEEPAMSAVGTRPLPAHGPHAARSGCCGAQATQPGTPIAMAIIVLALVLRRRAIAHARARTAR